MNVLLSILIPVIIVLIAIALLGVRVFFTKKGEFPNIHIGGSKAMKQRGIACATTQDRDAQKTKNFIDLNKVLNEIEK